MQYSELLKTGQKLHDVEIHRTDSEMWQVIGKTQDDRLVNLGRAYVEGEAITMALEARKQFM